MGSSAGRRPHLCFVGWADHVHLERWAGYFAKQGYQVSVITFSKPGHYPPGVSQYEIGLKGRGLRWVILKIRYLLWRIKPDVVHVHWAHFAPQVRAAWPGPLMVTAWGSDIYLRERFSDAQWAQTGAALRSANLITCDSADLATAIETTLTVPASRIEVVQWGVDTDLFSPNGPDLRATLGLGERPVIFSVRNFTPLYNQETVVAAFDQLHRLRPDAYLLMKNYRGDPEYVTNIKNEINTRGLDNHCRIIETIPYEEMPALYRTASAVVSIPHSDATPMTLLEAMSTGNTPIVSNLPSLHEWIRHGETGYLVTPTNIDDVTAGLCWAINRDNQSNRLHSSARKAILTTASQEIYMSRIARHYANLYNN